MFKVKWFDIEPGKDIHVNGKWQVASEVQARIMERMNKELKRDKLELTGGDDAGFLIYTPVIKAKAVKDAMPKPVVISAAPVVTGPARYFKHAVS